MRAVIIGLVMVLSGAAWAQPAPTFSDFSTGVLYRGARSDPDLSSREAYSFRTRLRQGASLPANFASNFRLVTWGCGTTCEHGAVIDQRNGRVTFLPFFICCTKSEEAAEPIDFRSDSALIVFTGLRGEQEPDGRHYYRFTGEQFVHLKSVGLTASDQLPQVAASPQPSLGQTSQPEEFPIADVEGKCHRMMRQQPFIGECIRREQAAYEWAKVMWRDLSDVARLKSRKWEEATNPIVTNPAYYQNLIQALEQEVVRQRLAEPPPKFRY